MGNCQDHPRPRMWVPKYFSKRRKEWFLTNKYQPLCDYLSKPETLSIFYRQDKFCNLITDILTLETTGLRIYFAAYPNEGEVNVPAGFGNKITLIFAPTVQRDTTITGDRGDYYLLNPGADHINISSKAHDWISNYQTNQLSEVLNTLFHFPEGDTKCVWYEKLFIDEFITEILCQEASGIRVYLSSYSNDDDMVPRPFNIDKQYLKRLILQFSLTKSVAGSDVDFEIEDIDGFWERPKPPVEALDNGKLCPPSSNCP